MPVVAGAGRAGDRGEVRVLGELGTGRGEVVVITGVPLLVHAETLNNSTMAASASSYIEHHAQRAREILALRLHPWCALLPKIAEGSAPVPTAAPN